MIFNDDYRDSNSEPPGNSNLEVIMRLRLIILIVISACRFAVAQPELSWSRTFGGVDRDMCHAVVQTREGNYALLGGNRSIDGGGVDNDIWFINTDSRGNDVYSRLYNSPGEDCGYDMKQTTDGGYVIAGASGSYGPGLSACWLCRCDSRGDPIWQQTYGNGGEAIEVCKSVVQTEDGGFLLAGYTEPDPFEYHENRSDFYLVKTDAEGELEWDYAYDFVFTESAEVVIKTDDGGYLVAGGGAEQDDQLSAWDFIAFKINEIGELQWWHTYGGDLEYEDICLTALQTDDSGFLLAGRSKSSGAGDYDFYLVKTDDEGVETWNDYYGGEGEDICESIVDIRDGGYLLAGSTTSFGEGGYDMCLLKVDVNGDLKWSIPFGGDEDDFCTSAQQTADGGFILGGYTNSFGEGEYDFWLVKTEPEPDVDMPLSEDWNDGDWTKDAPWYECESLTRAIFINEDMGHNAPPCAEVIGGYIGTDGTALSAPMNCGEEFTIDFWLHQRTETFSIFKVGVCQGKYSRNNRGLQLTVDFSEEDHGWYLNIWDWQANRGEINQTRIEYHSDRWINVVMSRYPEGLWDIIWDRGGENERFVHFTDGFEELNDPNIWWGGSGHGDIEGGAYIDDIRITVPREEIGFINRDEWNTKNVAVSGDYVYIANGEAGISVIDIFNPDFFNLLGSFNTPGDAFDVAILEERYLCVADGDSGLRIIDVGNPRAPIERGSCDTRDIAYGVVVAGSLAYVADGDRGLCVIDVSNPRNPVEIGRSEALARNGVAFNVALDSNFAYVAAGPIGLRVFDISNPSQPREEGFYRTRGLAYNVDVASHYAYVADSDEGLIVLDVSNPHEPREVGTHSLPGSARDVAVSGGFAYCAASTRGLRIVDVTNPESTRDVDYSSTEDMAIGVTVDGAYAYVADRYGGLRVIDVSAPGEMPPVLSESWDDGEWDVDPTWCANDNEYSSFSVVAGVGRFSSFCADMKNGRFGTEYRALYTPMNCGEKFTIDLYIQQKPRSYGFFKVGVCPGEYSRYNRGVEISVERNPRNGNWYLNYWDHVANWGVNNRIRLTYDRDRWINLSLERDENSIWGITWDRQGDNEYTIWLSDNFENLEDPHIWWGGASENVNEEGAYVDDIRVFSERAASIPNTPDRNSPQGFSIASFYPNPFNATTRLSYHTPVAGSALIKAYNITGRMIATLIDGEITAGNHSVLLDGGDLCAGIYIVKVQVAGFNTVQKVVLVR